MFSFERGGPCRRLRGRFAFALSLGAALLALAPATRAADIPCEWTGVERIVAVGDLHGDFDNFVTILKASKVGLVDERLHWTGGRTHLVQIGDVLDRGDKARDIFDFLMRLEKEAAAAGGMVHVLLGNHEESTITGIALNYPQYVFVDQFYAFLPDDFKKARAKQYLSGLPAAERARLGPGGPDFAKDAGYRAFWEKILETSKRVRGMDEAGQAYTENFNHTYGKWLLTKNVVIKINDVVFAHAGVNRQFSTWKLKDLNDAFRLELGMFALRGPNSRVLMQEFRPKLVYNSEGPLWLRQMENTISQEDMDRILANLKATKMVIGHNFMAMGETRSPIAPAGDIIPLFHGKLWMIDTGIGFTLYGGRLYALIINGGTLDHYTDAEEAAPPAPGGSPTANGPGAADEVERFLQTATPAFVIPGEAGRTDPWKVRLEAGGAKHWAQFKYIDRRRPDPLADSYEYELAAYALDKALGLGLIPPLIERTINGYPGSLQIFVEDAFSETARKGQGLPIGDPEAFERTMADLRVFINLVADTCGPERERDILIQRNTERVWAVDFSRAFAPVTETVPGCEIQRCSRAFYRKLVDWDKAGVRRLVAPYLNEEEVRALEARVGSILRAIRTQVEARGEAAVLF
ncbi:MAG TPA: metallophosphoesterase [Terriglobales bacterium]|nr:metallophosphoesterase [Terriglobales bacterium]